MEDRFLKTFMFGGQQHLGWFRELSATQQKAVVLLREAGVPAVDTYDLVIDLTDLELHPVEETVEKLYLDYRGSTAI